MAVLVGRVFRGFGESARNPAAVSTPISEQTGLTSTIAGTLNVRLDRGYRIPADADTSEAEYHGWERLTLRRCCINGDGGPPPCWNRPCPEN